MVRKTFSGALALAIVSGSWAPVWAAGPAAEARVSEPSGFNAVPVPQQAQFASQTLDALAAVQAAEVSNGQGLPTGVPLAGVDVVTMVAGMNGPERPALLAALYSKEVADKLLADLKASPATEGSQAAAALERFLNRYAAEVRARPSAISSLSGAAQVRVPRTVAELAVFYDGYRGHFVRSADGGYPIVFGESNSNKKLLPLAPSTADSRGRRGRGDDRLVEPPTPGSADFLKLASPVNVARYRPNGGKPLAATNGWVAAAQDVGDSVLLRNYAPSAEVARQYDGSALPALRMRARDQTLDLVDRLLDVRVVKNTLLGEGPQGELSPAIDALADRAREGDSTGVLLEVAGLADRLGTSGDLTDVLNRIVKIQLDLKTAVDHLKMSSDGIGRNFIHYWTPDELKTEQRRRGWVERDGLRDVAGGEPIADVVIVGAGPSGLAAAYYAAAKLSASDPGFRTVLIEGGYVGQAFSDGGSPSVHYMRTSRWTTTLALPGVVAMRHVAELSLARISERLAFKAVAQRALKKLEETSKTETMGRSREERRTARYQESWWRYTPIGWLDRLWFYAMRERVHPLARAELFQYLNHIGAMLAEKDNAMVLEQSPVTSVKKRADGLWEVRTRPGHVQLARNVALATGIVGTDADFAKVPKEFTRLAENKPDDFLILENSKALGAKAEQVHDLFSKSLPYGPHSKQMMLVDTLLRTPEAQRWLKSLKPGSTVGVVGSGESAAKAVIDVLIQNPDLRVVLYAKQPIEPAQVQVPENYFTPALAERGLFDPKFGDLSVRQWKTVFGTPVTPQTMADLIKAQVDGRLQIYELGTAERSKHLTEKVVDLRSDRLGDGGAVRVGVTVTDRETVENLKKQRREWKQKYGMRVTLEETADGLSLGSITGGFVFASGFGRSEMRMSPLMTQIVADGHADVVAGDANKYMNGELELGDNRFTSKDQTLALTGIANTRGSAADSAIPGFGVRGYHLMRFWKGRWGEKARAAVEHDGTAEARMMPKTKYRLRKMPQYRRPWGYGKLGGVGLKRGRGVAADPTTADPTLLPLAILPVPLVALGGMMSFGFEFWEAILTAGMMGFPATFLPGIGRLPYFKQKFARPVDVIVRRLDTKRIMGRSLSKQDRLLLDRADQLRDREAKVRVRFGVLETPKALLGLLASFRVYRPRAVPRREAVPPARRLEAPRQ